MNIAHIEKQSFIYGPGCRYVIWTQGCSIRCEGCWNNEMWSFESNIILSILQIFEEINAEKEFIEGVTILGGEPLDQYTETLKLLKLCKNVKLTTMLFTGYEIHEINNKNMSEILDYCDILITGRYNLAKRTINHQWIGSTNQEIHFLTENYKNYEVKNANYVEINIEENGRMTALGFPEINKFLYSDNVYFRKSDCF